VALLLNARAAACAARPHARRPDGLGRHRQRQQEGDKAEESFILIEDLKEGGNSLSRW
jgi:hypothetical protein